MTVGVLLVGHGSRNASGNAQFLDLGRALAERLAPLPVQPCFLDHAEPSIQAGVDQLAEKGIRQIGVLPLFLFAAGHAKVDVPAQLRIARERHPAVSFHYGGVLGVERALVGVCAQRLATVEGGRAETAVLLVGRGSSDEEANEGLRQVAQMLRAETGYGWVETAYCDVAHPRVPEGLARCVGLGAKRVILLPYFLFKGVLMTRLQSLLAEWQVVHPTVAFHFAGAEGLAQGPAVLDLVQERIRYLL